MNTKAAAARPSRFTAARPIAVQIVALVLIAVALAGCGKKGAPLPPPGEPNTYPRVYPSE